MKKKTPKTPKQNLDKDLVLTYVSRAQRYIATHGVVLMFALAGAAIGFSLFRSRGYLNPIRDENHYQDESAKNNYSKIDYKLVQKLQDSVSAVDIKVDPNLAPNRKNPFSE